jgi:hypothetical protein
VVVVVEGLDGGSHRQKGGGLVEMNTLSERLVSGL